jgi:hypothetical protein
MAEPTACTEGACSLQIERVIDTVGELWPELHEV